MIFNDKEIVPEITSEKDWLLRHIGHKKVNQIVRESNGYAPDIKMVFCCKCREIFVAGFVGEIGE